MSESEVLIIFNNPWYLGARSFKIGPVRNDVLGSCWPFSKHLFQYEDMFPENQSSILYFRSNSGLSKTKRIIRDCSEIYKLACISIVENSLVGPLLVLADAKNSFIKKCTGSHSITFLLFWIVLIMGKGARSFYLNLLLALNRPSLRGGAHDPCWLPVCPLSRQTWTSHVISKPSRVTNKFMWY